MDKPYMHTFTAEQLLAWDHAQQMGRTDNRCLDCLAGVLELGPGWHREKPTPCAFKVKVEIGRRLIRFDEIVDMLETAQKARRWGW